MELTSYIRTVAALVLVLGMILAVLWALRRFGVPGMVPARPTSRRLSLVESLTVDSRRRLVLVSRDGREHLLLLGIAGDVVVEADIDGAGSGGVHREESKS